MELQSIRGLAKANGRDPIRFVTAGAIYDCGGLAPILSAGPTLASGTRATSTLECGAADIGANDQLLITDHLGQAVSIRFVAAASLPTPTGAGSAQLYVALAGTIDATLERLRGAIQGEGVNGVVYSDGVLQYSGLTAGAYLDIECPQAVNTTDHSLLFRVRTFGAHGNSYEPAIVIDSANGFTTGLGAGFFDSGGSGSFTTGTDASGTAPSAGTRRWMFTNFRAADVAETGASPTQTVTTSVSGNISLSALTANADTTFDFTRVYRTTSSGVEFYLVKTIPRSATTVTDDVSDANLVLGGNVPYEPNNFRTYNEGFPPRGRCLAFWKSRLWTGGAVLAAQYSRGTATATDGSASVTLASANPTQLMVGRSFQVASRAEKYKIISVNVATKVLELERSFVRVASDAAGTAYAGVSYTITDDRDPCQVYCSVPLLFNQWPVDNNPGAISTDDAEGITGFLATKNYLYVSSPTSITAITGEDIESWQMEKVVDGLGWVAERCCVPVDGGAVFLSRSGICAWDTVSQPQVISSPPTPRGRGAIGIEDTIARISWANVRQAFGTYHRELRQVRFAVPLDGAECPNYEIVLDLQNRTWSLFRRPAWTASCPIVLPGGGQALLYGGREGELSHADIGTSDGVYGIEPVLTLSGAQTKRVLTTDGTTLTGNYAGAPCIVIYAAASAVMAKVASNTTSAVTLTEDLATAPAAADQIVLGGIWWRAKTGFYSRGENFERTQWRDTTVSHIPIASGDYHYAFAKDNGTFSIPTQGWTIGSLSGTEGRRRFRNQTRGMTKADLFQGFKPGPAPTIRGVTLSVGMREKDGL